MSHLKNWVFLPLSLNFSHLLFGLILFKCIFHAWLMNHDCRHAFAKESKNMTCLHAFAPHHPPIRLIIRLFASLILDISMELRYTCVVRMELCPMPSLMTAMGMFISLATLAQVWRAT